MKKTLHHNLKLFKNNLNIALEKLRDIPISTKTDEVSTPLYLHKNFLIRKIFINRLITAYKMSSFSQKKILDFGCGSGIFLQAISHEIKEGIGVDLNIDIAKKIITSKNISLKQITDEKDILNFSNIDIITSFDVLEHVKKLDSVIDIFKKILSPDGIIIISGPTENFLYRLGRKITRMGLVGNILGEEEHVTNIIEIKEKMKMKKLNIEKNINIWNGFHVISFSLNKKYD